MTAPSFTPGEPLTAFSPAFEAVLKLRIAQVDDYGHTPEKDAALGAYALVTMARGATLKAAQSMVEDSASHQQMVTDQVMGQLSGLSDHDLDVAYSRLTKSSALNIAAADLIDQERAARRKGE